MGCLKAKYSFGFSFCLNSRHLNILSSARESASLKGDSAAFCSGGKPLWFSLVYQCRIYGAQAEF